jgi:hypothetical protein
MLKALVAQFDEYSEGFPWISNMGSGVGVGAQLHARQPG